MTCKHAKFNGSKPVCEKGYPIQLLKCMQGGLLCYQERNENRKEEKKQ